PGTVNGPSASGPSSTSNPVIADLITTGPLASLVERSDGTSSGNNQGQNNTDQGANPNGQGTNDGVVWKQVPPDGSQGTPGTLNDPLLTSGGTEPSTTLASTNAALDQTPPILN